MVPFKDLIGPALIAVAVAGALLYNGHQDRLQRQCLAATENYRKAGYSESAAARYNLDTLSSVYCAGWAKTPE